MTESAGNAETGASDMASRIEQALVSAGIAKLIGDITAAVISEPQDRCGRLPQAGGFSRSEKF